MSNIIGASVWVLITVTNAGAIHQESGFRNQALCEDAISIAKYGKTVAEHTEDQREAAAAWKQRKDEWRVKHPPREPKTDAERELIKKGDCSTYWLLDCVGTDWGSLGGVCSHTENGLIYEDDCASDNRSTIFFSGNNGNEIKFARCLPDPSGRSR